MDRLDQLSVLTLAIALIGCGTRADPPVAPTPARAEAAAPGAPAQAPLDAFCDLHATDDRAAAAFQWPELAPGGTAPGAAATWRWVNVWATWCEPCIEELPRLTAWRDRLAVAGKPIELAFVSVDDTDADVEAFRKAHPGMPPSIRVAGAEQRAAWLKAYGLSDGAIPIHLFVSPANRLRCARAGLIHDKDYSSIERLLGG